MDQTFDDVIDLDEGTERHELGDPALDDVTDLVAAGELPPRVFLGRLERERHPLALEIDVEDLDLDLLADLDDLRWVIDVLPGELRHVNQSVDATEVHEGTEVDDRRDGPRPDLALLERREELLALFGLGLLEEFPAGQHNVVPVLVQLDDAALELLAHIGLEVAHPAHLDQ